AEELKSEVAGRRVFLPRSDQANPELVDALNQHGGKARAFVAYKTVPADADAQRVQQTLSKSAPDAILFFSPSAEHHLCEILGPEPCRNLSTQSIYIAIGPITEKALRTEGVARLLVASDTTVTATIAVLAEFFSKAGQHQPAGAKQG